MAQVPEGVVELWDMSSAGFSDDEVIEEFNRSRREMFDAGFSLKEIGDHYGYKPNAKEDLIDANRIIANELAIKGRKDPLEDAEVAQTYAEAVIAGWQASVPGLYIRGGLPDTVLPPDAEFGMRAASAIGQMGPTGDLGLFLGGGAAVTAGSSWSGPAALVAGTAGAFYLPAALRKMLMDSYTLGYASTPQESMDRFVDAVIIEGGKGLITGTAVGTVAAAGTAAGLPLSGVALGEVAALLKFSTALEGRGGPTKAEAIDALAIIFGLKLVGAGLKSRQGRKIRAMYEELGITPRQLARDLLSNPSIIDDMHSSNISVPRTYARDIKNRVPLTKEEVLALEKAKSDRAAGDPEKVMVFDPKSEKMVEGTKTTLTETEFTRLQDITNATKREGRQPTKEESLEILEIQKKVRQRAIESVTDEQRAVLRQKDIERGSKLTPEEGAKLEQRLREAADRSPEDYQAEKLLQDEMILRGKVRRLERESGEFATPEQNEVAASIIFNRIPKRTSKFSFADRFWARWSNTQGPIRVATDVMTDGKKVNIVSDPFSNAALNSGVQGKVEHFLHFGALRFKDLKEVGKSFADIVQPFRKGKKQRELSLYMAAKRHMELRARGLDSGIRHEAVEGVVRQLAPKYDKAAKELVEYQDNVLKYLRDSGVVDQVDYLIIKSLNEDYVPYHRIFDGEGVGAKGHGSIFNPVKRLTGSEKVMTNPLESIVKNTYTMIQIAESNHTERLFYDVVSASKHGDIFARRVKQGTKPITLTAEEQARILGNMLGKKGSKLSETEAAEIKSMVDNTLTIFRPDARMPRSGERVVFREGTREVWKVEPELIKAFESMGPQSIGVFAKLAGIFARTLRAGAVLAPEFVARNPARDQVSAFVFGVSKEGVLPYRPGIDLWHGVYEMVGKGQVYKDWLKSGAPMSSLVSLDAQLVQSNLREIMNKGRFFEDARNIAKSREDFMYIGSHLAQRKNPLKVLRAATEMSEAGSRIGDFRRLTMPARKAGRDLNLTELFEAGLESRRITLDFAVAGYDARSLNIISAFFSAKIRGLEKLREGFDPKNPNAAASITKAVAGITIPSIMLHLYNRHTYPDEYKRLKHWQRALFWNFATEDENGEFMWMRIPKPFELGVIFGTVPEYMAESILSEDETAFDELMLTLATDALPVPQINMLTPVVEQFANRTIFSDRPLIPERLVGALPEFQYSDATTESTKALSRLLVTVPGMELSSFSSPAVIENYITAWSGGLGRTVLSGLDAALRKTGVVPDPPKIDSGMKNWPVIKAFTYRDHSANGKPIDDFYTEYNKNLRYITSFKLLAARGDAAAAMALREREGFRGIRLNNVYTALNRMGTAARKVRDRKDLDPGEKRQLIESLWNRRILVAERGLKMFKGFDERKERIRERENMTVTQESDGPGEMKRRPSADEAFKQDGFENMVDDVLSQIPEMEAR